MSFENIIGNEKNKEFLNKIIDSNSTVHSYMFEGIEGIGKSIFAKEFAKMLLCIGNDKKNCARCKSCLEFVNSNNPDYVQIDSDGKIIKIEQIRQMQEKILEKPIVSSKKVYVINDADLMTKEAQNCLLKTLEEPPEFVIIILVLANESKILNTVKSRCMRIFFSKLKDEELKKYESTSVNSPECSIIRSYIDLLLNLPWNKSTTDNKDLILAKKILDETHYGLNDVKDRIVEYLALRTRTKNTNSSVICLVGPPGVGKTTLCKSIAKAMNRKYVKISVGGLNDSSEIMGNRRTYIGAFPGKIIQGIKKCGSNNPVFVIDEIDKLCKDIKGDPASSLLEVLDKEQNKYFVDNYVEECFDLSKVMFITTANDVENIPLALKDRLEIIDLSSYTEYEKLHIAKEHLIKLALEEYKLDSNSIKFSDEIIFKIIRCYTKEAGVRELERVINKIVRKIVKKMLEDKKDTTSVKITDKKLEELLGKPKYENTKVLESTPGVVNGLAYTSYGGTVLPIEVVMYPSKEPVKLTGNLGDVMKESVSIALGYIKSHAEDLKIDEKLFDSSCIHINAIEGGIPKDGPSAGTALTTAIISMLLKKSVPNTVAMTGEMTLTGKVLPIGGLKEKSLGAYQAGVNKMFVPKLNEADLSDIPKEVKDKIEIVLVQNYMDIYNDLFKGSEENVRNKKNKRNKKSI